MTSSASSSTSVSTTSSCSGSVYSVLSDSYYVDPKHKDRYDKSSYYTDLVTGDILRCPCLGNKTKQNRGDEPKLFDS